MITVVTPFSRTENKDLLLKSLHLKANLIILQADDEPVIDFPDWVDVRRYPVTNKSNISNRLFNEFIANGVDPDTQYMILNDDDSVEEGFFDKIPNAPVVVVSMKRGDTSHQHVVFDNWKTKSYYLEDGPDVLIAHPDHMRVARVGGEQLIVKGHVLKNYRYGLTDSSADKPGDWQFIEKVLYEYDPVYVPDAYVLFNYYEDGRFTSFKRPDTRLPLVLFVCDYYCAGDPRMGPSEWEGNLWASLESTGLANIVRFHPDKFYLTTGTRGDATLLERINELHPDLIIMVIYKEPGSVPTTISLPTISAITTPIISIWGDLEAPEQQHLAATLAPFMKKIIATASKSITESLGYTYLHVPKDPRYFNNPDLPRDIDIVFSGSYGHGREERQEAMNYLLSNNIRLIHGGSEGGDHFTVEEYANRYKRAKLALSFSRARNVNVVNARPFEAMACGALLLEQESLELSKLYTPYVDYVPWTDKDDLLKKVNYYLEHDEERVKIAESGCRKTHELYSAKTFWEKVFSPLASS